MGRGYYHNGFRSFKPSRDKKIFRPFIEPSTWPIAEDMSFDQLLQYCHMIQDENVVSLIFDYLKIPNRQQKKYLIDYLFSLFPSQDYIILLICHYLLWLDVDESESDDEQYDYIPIDEDDFELSSTSACLQLRQDLAPLPTRYRFHYKSPKRGRLGNGKAKQHSSWSFPRLHQRIEKREFAKKTIFDIVLFKRQTEKPRSPFYKKTKILLKRLPKPKKIKTKSQKRFICLNQWKRTCKDALDELL